MSIGLADWLMHPVTMTLLGAGALLLFATIEILLRSLAEMGNVRFQGVLEDNPKLFKLAAESSLHICEVLDSLRWLQIPSLGCIWFVVLTYPFGSILAGVTVCLLLPLATVILVRVVIGSVGEPIVVVLLRLVRPLAGSLLLLARTGARRQVPPAEDEEEEASEREIQALLDVGQAAGIFEKDEGEFVESLVDFFDTTVREVMTPRTAMVALPETATREALLEAFTTTGKSRIPIYRDTIDDVIGVVHVKSLVMHDKDDEPPPLSELVHESIVVPESKRLGLMLRDFQRLRLQMAIVVDEYGGTSGLVTLEDILEEIVGEIEDEHDPKEPPEVERLGGGVYRLQGRADVDELENLFGLKVEEADVDTVGGLVFSRHGTVPEPGTDVVDTQHGLLFTVEEMDGRRIGSVTVRRTEGEPEQEGEQEP